MHSRIAVLFLVVGILSPADCTASFAACHGGGGCGGRSGGRSGGFSGRYNPLPDVQGLVKRVAYSNWQPVDGGPQQKFKMSFDTDSTGRILHVRLLNPTGSEQANLAAVKAVNDASGKFGWSPKLNNCKISLDLKTKARFDRKEQERLTRTKESDWPVGVEQKWLLSSRSKIRSGWEQKMCVLSPYSVLLTFNLAEDGTIDDISVSKSSGSPANDQTATEILEETAKLPPYPTLAAKKIAMLAEFYNTEVKLSFKH